MEDEICFVGRSPVSGFGHTKKKAERPREREIGETLVNVSFGLRWEISRMCNLTADPNKGLQSRNTARPRGRRETFGWL